MAVRNIVKIDEDKCNGCGKCISACAEGAIQMVSGKAKLVSDVYCDGLGACLGTCPQDAITIEQREAHDFDEKVVEKYLAAQKEIAEEIDFVCPGLMAKEIERDEKGENTAGVGDVSSQLSQWPVQLSLISATAPYLKGCDLLIVADCVPLVMGDFHGKFLKGKKIVVCCPKLDDTAPYVEKLADMIKANELSSLAVVHMEVPCCSALTRITQQAVMASGLNIGFDDVTIGLKGNILKTERIGP